MRSNARPVAAGFHLLESPRWHDGALYASDFYAGVVLRFDGDRPDIVARVDGRPSGLGWDQSGRLLVVSMLDRRVLRLDESRLVTHADLSPLFPAPANDMAVDAEGRAWVGGFGTAEERLEPSRLARVEPDGTVTEVGGPLHFPNGIVVNTERRLLLVAETFASQITGFTLTNGQLSEQRVWASFASGTASTNRTTSTSLRQLAAVLPVLPDGICLDAEGCIWMGSANGVGAYRVAEGGEIVDFVSTAPLSALAVALGGDDGRELYLCCAPPSFSEDRATNTNSVLMACRVDVPVA